MVERGTLNAEVTGSSPASPASEMVERVAGALRNNKAFLSNPEANALARAAIAEVSKFLTEEANRMQFSEDRHGLFCAVETIDEALK